MVGPRVVVVLFIFATLAGCANLGAEGVHATDNKAVQNAKDHFSYSMSAVNKTKMESYKWENGAPRASVGYSGAVQGGDLTVTIYDAANLIVYYGAFDGSESQGTLTETGLAGVWTIDLHFDQYMGALSLGVAAHHEALL